MPLNKFDMLRTIFIFISFVIFFILASTGLSQVKLELILLGFVATFGLSHGSLDWALARHWGIRQTLTENILFIAFYAMIVLMTLGVWSLFPTIALIIFLLMSIFHFANDWLDELSRGLALMLGLSTIAIPGIAYQKDIFDIFKLLVPDSSALYLSDFLHIAGFFH